MAKFDVKIKNKFTASVVLIGAFSIVMTPAGLELSGPFTTAEKLGSGQFATALRRIGLAEVDLENFTLFAPTDEAYREAGLIQVVEAIR